MSTSPALCTRALGASCWSRECELFLADHTAPSARDHRRRALLIAGLSFVRSRRRPLRSARGTRGSTSGVGSGQSSSEWSANEFLLSLKKYGTGNDAWVAQFNCDVMTAADGSGSGRRHGRPCSRRRGMRLLRLAHQGLPTSLARGAHSAARELVPPSARGRARVRAYSLFEPRASSCGRASRSSCSARLELRWW